MFSRLTIFTLLILAIFISDFNLIGKETGIQVIPVFDYITGRFNPASHADIISLTKAGIPCAGDLYPRKETTEALKHMLNEFKKEHQRIKIHIQSTTRNFYLQKTFRGKKWHWSFVTLSKQYLNEWNKIYRDDPSQFTPKKNFSGSDASGHPAPIFVNSINPACK